MENLRGWTDKKLILYTVPVLPVLKSSQISKFLPKRRKDSHKGDNGKVLIVGGSLEYFGAPILSAMGALRSGCDLVYLLVPECNFEVTRNHSSDFIVRKYPGNYLNSSAIMLANDLVRECTALLIGPGVTNREESVEAIRQILMATKIPTVLDSTAMYALKKIPSFPLPQPIVVTPHMNEFQKLIDRTFSLRDEETLRQKKILYLQTLSKDLRINIVLKGMEDFITSDRGETFMNETGDSGMTVGGSGDVLAGFIASLIAQGSEVFDACRAATFLFGLCGEQLFKEKGYGYTATDLAHQIPYILKKFL